ncbi:hypothetical protein NUACC26_041640 [Scytonema sp. NUACC26]
MLAGAGGVAGASIGRIGIFAKGSGFSVSTVPLTAAGALTGLALYEVIRAITTWRFAKSTGTPAANNCSKIKY